jgi:hypothetical protein
MMSYPIGSYEDYEVLNEPWLKFKLSDGSLLRFKVVLVEVLKTGQYDQYGRPVYGLATTNVISIRAPKELKGEPTIPPPSSQELGASIVEEVKITPINQHDNNSYSLDDGTTVTINVLVTSVKRTNKYAFLGEPLYLIDSQNIPKFDVPQSLWKHQL